MSISQLARSLHESATLRMNERAKIMRERGDALIHLGSGEPKSKVPFDAILNASSKLVSANVKYTEVDGIPSLKKAIVRYTEENYNKIVGPENIIVSNGAKQSLSILLQSILNEQEEVILLSPYWVSYPELVKIANGIPIIVTPEDGGYHPRIQDIDMAVGRYTKAVIVNSPCNPSGLIFSRDFIAEIVNYCERKGIYLIMDDIYHKLIFNGKSFISCYDFAKDQSNNSKLIVVNGVSKLYGMTGFRVGWVIANTHIVEAMKVIQSHVTSCPSVVVQAAAAGALTGIQSGVESLRLTLENNRNVMITELKSFDGVKVTKPDGTFYCFPDFSAYNKNSAELSEFLLRKVMVVTVPGKEFGMDGHLRLSYCGTIKDIKEGIERIKWAIDPNSPNEIYIGDRKLVRDWL
ncbi:MAG: pyridoxal phosphate-dependent aminotransferase [Candidatus Neomarinimicrobiota bacterium]|nr:MAG: pyridoxal phosphate-dependent aminotransferase [Candidatus Neomarinimicrobiota bacterium]